MATSDEETRRNIHLAEVSLASNVYPLSTVAAARAALDTAGQARADGDGAAALTASELALRILADTLRQPLPPP
ncbi:hypothetical protein [Streptomyces sp. NBC_00272]|uniref:hypothetical protein n=1 Tax=Streptomyces sp. NBC_00272 TaxID=2975698 RepID=UPI002E2A1680|nr:hypothetical protein [Streptomyces sp. NBC_00272]